MQFADYGSERIVDIGHLYVLTPQFRSLCRQGVRCCLATAADAAEMPANVVSRKSLEEVMLNKLVVIKVLSVSDEDTCQVTLPLCDQNQQQIPQLARYFCCQYLLSVLLDHTTSTQPGHPSLYGYAQ